MTAQPATISDQAAARDTAPVALCAHVDTPIGRIAVIEEAGAIVRLLWHSEAERHPATQGSPVLYEAKSQLRAYFDHRLQCFDLPLKHAGSPLDHAVQRAMLAIPYGETRTYGDIAKELGTYGQPVGRACGANPIPVIIPCHRVLSAVGLGGFSGEGGVEMKIRLLKHEGGYPLLL